jgi:hypothetical protein
MLLRIIAATALFANVHAAMPWFAAFSARPLAVGRDPCVEASYP